MLFGCPYFLCRKSVLLVSKVNIPTNLCFLSISCIYPAWREISPQNMQNLSENTFQKFTWWTLSLRIRIYLNFHQEFFRARMWSRCHSRPSFETILGFPFKQHNSHVPLHGQWQCRTSHRFLFWQPVVIFFSLSSKHHHFHIPNYCHHIVLIISDYIF